jgi:CCR4-NOT transcription complex subunit 7/8
MYDFAYLLKVLTNEKLPSDPDGFFEILHRWFPKLVDLK